MSQVKFEGIDEDLTAPRTPWIYYGGSYAGARAAHMKILYPDLVFGAIASSGVTHAVLSNWEYYEVIRKAADPACSAHLENAITTVDTLLQFPVLKDVVKALFGLHELKHDDDFVSVLEGPLGAWQSKNWDPAVGSTSFDEFCESLSKPVGAPHIGALPIGHEDRLVTLLDDQKIDFSVLNFAQWVRENAVKPCLALNMTVEECFGTYNDTQYTNTSLTQEWRLWQFQVCTEWGYFSTAPPDPNHPRIVSKLLTMDYATKLCRQAFPPGKHFTVPAQPDISVVNALGDFAIAADRLAIIDGEVDPWRPCTPHSEYAKDRKDTILRPFKLIPMHTASAIETLLSSPPRTSVMATRTSFTLASRQSELAKIQTNIVTQTLVDTFPSYAFETRFNETEGDKNQSQALFLLGGKALWTRGLEELLANKQVDMLVHSLKDVPTELPAEFKIGAILEREESVDCLVMKAGSPYKMFEDMPAGSRIGTSSVRRSAQVKNYLKEHHKGLEMTFKDVRDLLLSYSNTRLKKLDATGEDDAFDALILAKAGLVRLGWSNRATQDLVPPVLYYAVSQGALAVEIRADASDEVSELCEALTHQRTQWVCLAERAMLRTLEGGCSVPVGVNTKLTHVVEGNDRLRNGELKVESAVLEITGCVTSLDGGQQFVKTMAERVTSTSEAEALGKRLGVVLLDSGAREILEEIKADRASRVREAEVKTG
ncbi:hypothetical protein JVT61DRAFT_9261 [Boletus reticuloceps]|uniref:hydroxymethylbilane synthase n=1 Tax=Boletus reticuloceps TaxID=495285 RepID=A0A8I3A6I8_9AGAM|nr:hypothetical protein JVT61DRAFT_9261 [Boletus reticuloceps]